MKDARNTIVENVLAFCNQDKEKGKELFSLIQTTISEDHSVLQSLDIQKDSELIGKMMSRLILSLSILMEKQILDSACIIEEKIAAKSTIPENLYSLFIKELGALKSLLDMDFVADYTPGPKKRAKYKKRKKKLTH